MLFGSSLLYLAHMHGTKFPLPPLVPHDIDLKIIPQKELSARKTFLAISSNLLFLRNLVASLEPEIKIHRTFFTFTPTLHKNWLLQYSANPGTLAYSEPMRFGADIFSWKLMMLGQANYLSPLSNLLCYSWLDYSRGLANKIISRLHLQNYKSLLQLGTLSYIPLPAESIESIFYDQCRSLYSIYLLANAQPKLIDWQEPKTKSYLRFMNLITWVYRTIDIEQIPVARLKVNESNILAMARVVAEANQLEEGDIRARHMAYDILQQSLTCLFDLMPVENHGTLQAHFYVTEEERKFLALLKDYMNQPSQNLEQRAIEMMIRNYPQHVPDVATATRYLNLGRIRHPSLRTLAGIGEPLLNAPKITNFESNIQKPY